MNNTEYDKTEYETSSRRVFRVHPGALAAVIAGGAVAAYAIWRKRSADSKILDGFSGKGERRKSGSGEYCFVRTQTIDRPASELWAFWREEENAPHFMQHIASVRRTGSKTSHWVMQAPGGPRMEWDSEIYEERPGQLLAWRTLQGDWKQNGRLLLRPAPGDRGTEVRLEMSYDIPGGAIARSLATMLGREPEQIGQANLARFKQLMEAGEIITVQGQPHGKRGGKGKLMQVLLREPEAATHASNIQHWASRAQKRVVSGSETLRNRWQQAARQGGASTASSASWKRLRANW
jgi:uncharacterized membrane protein